MLRGFVEQAEALRLDPVALARTVGIDPAALTHPDLQVPVTAMTALYDLAAARSRADDFALRVVAGRRISNLGVIALLARESSTVREALTSIQRYLWVQNEGIGLSMDTPQEGVLLRIHPQVAFRKQAVDLSLGMLVVSLRYLIGDSWRPRAVFVTYAQPEQLGAYQQVFGGQPRFDQDLVGLLISQAEFETRLPGADPDFVFQLRRQLEQATRNRAADFVASVRALIAQRLAEGGCDLDQLAAALALSRRSFQRKLSGHGFRSPGCWTRRERPWSYPCLWTPGGAFRPCPSCWASRAQGLSMCGSSPGSAALQRFTGPRTLPERTTRRRRSAGGWSRPRTKPGGSLRCPLIIDPWRLAEAWSRGRRSRRGPACRGGRSPRTAPNTPSPCG